MRKAKTTFWTLCLWVAAQATTLAWAGPDPDSIKIRGLTHGGSGCPGRSVASYLSDDAQAFTLIFDAFTVTAGPGINREENRKFCNVNLDLLVPAGWQYSIFKVDYYGFADLDRGAYGNLSSTYRFSGAVGRNSVTLHTNLYGDIVDNYEVHDDIGIETLVWSPCGVNRALNIKTEARVAASGRSNALLTVDSVDGEFVQIYAMKWQRCR